MITSPKRYLFASDFDETAFHTISKPSPYGMDVNRAYTLALDDIFLKLGLGRWYTFSFGHQNHSPSEVIQLVLDNFGIRNDLLHNAKKFFDKSQGSWNNLIPECKDGNLVWNTNAPEQTITQMLVVQKLKYLLEDIGERDKEGKLWPQPCKGFMEFMDSVHSLKSHGYPVDTAIISSGHEVFIKKALDLWRIPHPDILVTDDDIRPLRFPEDPAVKFKPGVFPLALAHFKWLSSQTRIPNDREESRARILYVGDDPIKDGRMASHAKILGYRFPSTPWEAISDLLLENRHLLDGRPLLKIVSTLRDGLETDSLSPHNVEKIYYGSGKERR